MKRVRIRPLWAAALLALCCASCGGGKRFYPVRGHVLVNGRPAAGVTVVFHPADASDPHPVQPSALVEADGSFALKSYVVQSRALKDGAPAGRYFVTCTWYPAELQNFAGVEVLPDKLGGKYAVPKTSGLTADVPERPTELPPFELVGPKK